MKAILRPHPIFFFPDVLIFFTGKKNHNSKKIREMNRAKKSKKKIRNFRTSSQPGPSLAVDIVGPFLNNPFRRLTPTASTGMPGRGRAPVLLSLFIIRTEIF